MPIAYLSEPPATADLVIVGGGILGTATAFHASRAGLRPLVLERRPALSTLTTAAAAGGFRLQLESRQELDLIGESVELFLHFEDATGQREHDAGLRQQGYLWVTTSDEGIERQRRLVDVQRSWGLTDVQLIADADLLTTFPFLAQRFPRERSRLRLRWWQAVLLAVLAIPWVQPWAPSAAGRVEMALLRIGPALAEPGTAFGRSEPREGRSRPDPSWSPRGPSPGSSPASSASSYRSRPCAARRSCCPRFPRSRRERR